jgi:hypothetical protein
MGTSWSSPKTNIFSAIWCLRGALQHGNYKLIREFNENCDYPIYDKQKENSDFREYKATGAAMYTRKEIEESNKSDFEKYLMLNYYGCFGTREAIEHYYTTGEVSADNFRGIGVSHLVKVSDMVDFFEKVNGHSDNARCNIFKMQYITLETANEKHFYTTISLKRFDKRTKEKFNHKLWVVADSAEHKIPFIIRVLNVLVYPLKFIPQKSVLRMDEYVLYTFRIGGVINGYSLQFQIPKKFSFSN